jgi:hypothetical protein
MAKTHETAGFEELIWDRFIDSVSERAFEKRWVVKYPDVLPESLAGVRFIDYAISHEAATYTITLLKNDKILPRGDLSNVKSEIYTDVEAGRFMQIIPGEYEEQCLEFGLVDELLSDIHSCENSGVLVAKSLA